MSEQPSNVISALARVTAELGGIEKLSPEERRKRGLGGGDERGVSYAYRGVDQIAAAAGPLFGKYGVVVVPDVVQQTVEPLTINGKPWTDTAVEVVWSLYGPGGLEDRITSRTRGLGRDNSDKGPNKALTQSYKNLLLRLLCIGDPADDVDGHTHEADARQERTEPNPKAEPLIDRLAVLPEDVQNTLLQWFKVSPAEWSTLEDGPLDKLAEQISKAENKVAAQTAGPQEEPTVPGPSTSPAPAEPVVRPATNKPSAAARAALAGEKPALGAMKTGEPNGVEGFTQAFPGSEEVAS